MPGFAGFLKAPVPEDASSIVARMLEGMMHERCYVSGSGIGFEEGVLAGWVARNASNPVCQWNGGRTIGLVLCGELVHNSVDQKAVLQSLIEAYEARGAEFLNSLNGWFAGVLFDVRRRVALLFNDRFGLGRVYFHEGTDGFYFGTEAKALLQVLPQTRCLDERGVGEWLSCGCVLQNRTLFSGIQLLPAGSVWTLSAGGKVHKARYFDPAAWHAQPALPEGEYYEQLKRLFPRVLARYLSDAEPLAMSLTGGLDGRMIMSWSCRGAGQLPCYTFNGPMRVCADVRIARQVARACDQSHQTLALDASFFGEFPALAEKAVYISDGAMDVTGAAELYMNRQAREIAPVRLTGNYGSEILRGHVAFRSQALPDGIFSNGCVEQGRVAARTYAEEAQGNRLAFIAFKQVPWHHFARFAVEQSQLRVRSPFLDNDLVALAFQAPELADFGLELSLRLVAQGNPRLAAIPTDRGLTYPAGGYGNRLRRSFHEFMAKAEYAYDYGMPSWLARADRCVAPLCLERLFLGRQKFCHFRSWYRGPLSEFTREVLLDSRSRARSYLNPSGLQAMVNGHIRGTSNHTVAIHKLLSLELLQRRLLDTQPVGRAPSTIKALEVAPVR